MSETGEFKRRWIAYDGPTGGMGLPSSGFTGHWEYLLHTYRLDGDEWILEGEMWISGMSKPYSLRWNDGGKVWLSTLYPISQLSGVEDFDQRLQYVKEMSVLRGLPFDERFNNEYSEWAIARAGV